MILLFFSLLQTKSKMAAKRPGSSYASSSVGLQPFHLNPNNMHSQTWTLVNEFYMGGRQQRILDPHEVKIKNFGYNM